MKRTSPHLAILILLAAFLADGRAIGADEDPRLAEWRRAIFNADHETVGRMLDDGFDPRVLVDPHAKQTAWSVMVRHAHSSPRDRAKWLKLVDVFLEECPPKHLEELGVLHDLLFRHEMLDEAERILDRGVDVDARDDDQGQTALHRAVTHRKPDLVEFLVRRKADLEAADRQGFTPLLHATLHACRREVSQRISSQHRGYWGPGNVPIDFTRVEASLGTEEMVRLLLKLGADPQGATPLGVTPLHLAAMIEQPRLASALADRPRGFFALFYTGSSRVMAWPSSGDWAHTRSGFHGLPVVELLLENEARTDVRIGKTLTPLDVAATPQIRKRLEAAGARSGLEGLAAIVAAKDLPRLRNYEGNDLDEPTLGGFTPLTWAVLHRQNEAAAALLHLGANPDRRDDLGFDPLWLALVEDDLGAVKILLASGVATDRPMTEIHIPLLRLKAYYAVPPPGSGIAWVAPTPLGFAMQSPLGDRDHVRGIGRWNAFRFRPPKPDAHLLEVLLEAKIDPNSALDDTGTTPLHRAASLKDLDALRLLLKYGADPQRRDSHGKIPADYLPIEIRTLVDQPSDD